MNVQSYSTWYDIWSGKGKVNHSNIRQSLKQRYEMCCFFFFVYFWNIVSFFYTIANDELVLFWIWIELKFVKPTFTRFLSQILVIVIGPSGVQFTEFGLKSSRVWLQTKLDDTKSYYQLQLNLPWATTETHACLKSFIHLNSRFWVKKTLVLPIQKFPSLVPFRNAIMIQHRIIQFFVQLYFHWFLWRG